MKGAIVVGNIFNDKPQAGGGFTWNQWSSEFPSPGVRRFDHPTLCPRGDTNHILFSLLTSHSLVSGKVEVPNKVLELHTPRQSQGYREAKLLKGPNP
jgi:hypothetical protein